MTFHYRAFDLSLESAVKLPGLPRQPATIPDCILRVEARERPLTRRIAAEQTIDGQTQRVWDTRAGLLYQYDPVGAFEISRDGREIVWFPRETPLPQGVQAVILGPVLALMLHARGTPCLHASGVMIGSQGVAFLAPKGGGKSTLVSAVVESGCQLMSDDILAVRTGSPAALLPGVHSVKLWGDAVERLNPRLPRYRGAGPKHTLLGFPREARRSQPAPFAAAYVLWPKGRGAFAAVGRERLGPRDATLALVAHAKVGELLAPAAAARLFESAAALARSVPVFALPVPRDWERLREVVGALREWHGRAPGDPSLAEAG